MLVAIVVPFFGGLLSFLGGFAFAPASYWVSSNNYIPSIDLFQNNSRFRILHTYEGSR